MKHQPLYALVIFAILVLWWAGFTQTEAADFSFQGTSTAQATTTNVLGTPQGGVGPATPAAPPFTAAATSPSTVIPPASTPTPLTSVNFGQDNSALIILSVVILLALGGAVLYSSRGAA